MDNIRQQCPKCLATLELPASAIGRTARCPACQTEFTVQGAPAAAAPATSDSAAENSGSEEWAASSAESFGAGGSSPFSSPTNPAKTTDDTNPYAASDFGDAGLSVQRGELQIQTAKIDFILNNAWEIFCARWQPLVIAGLVFFVVNLMMGIALGGVGAAIGMANQGDRTTLMVVTVAMSIPVGLVGWYLWLGIASLALQVARNQPATFADAFIGPGKFIKFLPLLVLFLGISTVTTIISQQMQGNMDETTFDPQTIFASIGVSLAGGLANAIILLFVWPIMYLVVDDRPNAYGTGLTIATSNLLAGFLIWWIIQLLLAVPTMLTCSLGAIVTQPLILMFGAVGYLAMTGQPVSNPRATPVQKPNYG